MLKQAIKPALAGICIYVAAMSMAAAQTTGIELVPNNGVSNILFGTSVGISGDIAAVGAAFDNGNRGSVYVYQRNGGAWPYEATLVPSEAIVGDQVGAYTEVYGNQVFAGSPAHGTPSGPYPGAVFVFQQNGSMWTETQMLQANPPVGGGRFGARYAVDGTTLIISGNNASSQQIAYLFTNQGGHWVQTGTLQPTEGGNFGTHVSISGNVAVVGASAGLNGASAATGVAYVFTRSGGVWNETTRLTGVTSVAGDQFGTSVSVSGDTIVVGAPHESVSGSTKGVAHVYKYSSGSWNEVTQLFAADGMSGNTFGKDVRVCGQRIFVGSSNLSQGSNSSEGAVYQWNNIAGVWTAEGEFTLPSPGLSNAYFGDHLGVSASGLIVGAPFVSQAYVYPNGCAVDPVYHDGFQ
jgi:FG-GAP repeat